MRDALAQVERVRLHTARRQRPPRIQTTELDRTTVSDGLDIATQPANTTTARHTRPFRESPAAQEPTPAVQTLTSPTETAAATAALRLLAQRSDNTSTVATHGTSSSAFHSHARLAAPEPVTLSSRSNIQTNTPTFVSHTTMSDIPNYPHKTPWRQVDESIDRIFHDPTTDAVRLELLRDHTSGGARTKRQRELARKRVLAAATALREREALERASADAQQRKKTQVEQLSDAIRARNRKLTAAAHRDGHSDDHVLAMHTSQRAETVSDGEMKRKPPVPRQRGRRKTAQSTRASRLSEMTAAVTAQLAAQSSRDRNNATPTRTRSGPREPQSVTSTRRSAQSVSSSILLGDAHDRLDAVAAAAATSAQETPGAAQQQEQEREPTDLSPPPAPQEVEELASAGPKTEAERPSVQVEHVAPKRLRRTRPRSSRETPTPPATTDIDAESATRTGDASARSERRELAREFMEMQRQSRRLERAKEAQRRALEQQKRQAQLRVLEHKRLASLEQSKRAMLKRTAQRSASRDKTLSRSAIESPTGDGRDDKRFSLGHSLTVHVAQLDPDRSSLDVVEHQKTDKASDDELFAASDQENAQQNAQSRRPPAPIEKRVDSGTTSQQLDQSTTQQEREQQQARASSLKPPTATTKAESTRDEADARVQRLLALEAKAVRLAALVNGIKGRTQGDGGTRSPLVQIRSSPPSARLDLPAHELHCVHERDVHSESDRSGEEEHGREDDHDDDESHDDESEGKPDEQDGLQRSTGTGADGQHSASGSDRESVATDEVRQPATAPPIAVLETMAAQMSSLSDLLAFDPRTIGVQRIKGEWPLQHTSLDGDDDGEEDNGGECARLYTSRRRRSDSSPSSSSSSSSSSASSRNHDRNASHRSSDGGSQASNRSRDDSVGASVHSLLRQQLHANESWGFKDDTTLAERRRRSGDAAVATTALHVRHASLTTDTSFDAMMTVASSHKRSTKMNREAATASDAFLKLVREADDSLSVINSAAHKIWREQQARLRAQAARVQQQALNAAALEEARKDEQVRAVLASLTAHGSASDASERSESDSDQGDKDNEEEHAPSPQSFRRLEDIMNEIEDERRRDATGALPSSTLLTDHHSAPPPSQTAFWNDLLAHAETTRSGARPRVEIDRSELQRQSRRRARAMRNGASSDADDEDESDAPSSVKCVHSPKTLAQLLLAEVEYHDAIHDAQLQLARMEHAHDVEQAQAETVTLATAYNDEMGQALTDHQLALDHAILTQQMDRDLDTVVRELDSVEQSQQRAFADATSALESELKRANLREATAQTESLARVDAATNAALRVETGTLTRPNVCDASVQYDDAVESASMDMPTQVDEVRDATLSKSETITHVPPVVASGDADKSDAHYSDDDDDAYDDDDAFESRSTAVVESRSVAPLSPVGSVSEGSDVASAVDESASAASSDEIASVASSDRDEVEDNDDVSEHKDNHSASIGYDDDDFEASASQISDAVASTAKARGAAQSNDVDDESEASAAIVSDQEDEDEVAEAQSASVSDDEVASDVDGDGDGSRDANAVRDASVSSASEYASEFSASAVESSAIAPRVKPTAAAATEQPQRPTLAVSPPITTVPAPVASPPVLQLATDNALALAYQRDLEMRRQSDESLLLLRLQALEHKLARDLEAIDASHARPDDALLRKEAVRMAHLAECANIESLRAASMARYYHDLLGFQALLSSRGGVAGLGTTPLSVLPSAAPLPPFAMSVMSPSAATAPVATIATTTPAAAPVSSVAPAKATGQAPASASGGDDDDAYGDDAFASGSGDAQDVASDADEEVDDQDATTAMRVETSESSASEIPDDADSVRDGASAANKDSGDGEVEDDDDAYGDDAFASASRSDGAPRPPSDDIVEDNEVSEHEERDDAVTSAAPSVVDDSIDDAVSADAPVAQSDAVDEEQDDAASDDYADEFASMSASDSAAPSKSADADSVDESDDDNSERGQDDAPAVQDDGDGASLVESEHFDDDDFEAEDNDAASVASDASQAHDEPRDAALASRDTVDEGAAAPVDASQCLDAASAILRDESTSEDSSTTKLLVAQVAHLTQQQQTPPETDAPLMEAKLARKKLLAVELVEAKTRLVAREASRFKIEEETRYVNALALRAIELDVHSALATAKAEIAQQLDAEMAQVQQRLPMAMSLSTKAATSAPSALSQAPTSAVAVAKSAPTRIDKSEAPTAAAVAASAPSTHPRADDSDEDDDAYAVESFEDAQSSKTEGDAVEDDDAQSFESDDGSAPHEAAVVKSDTSAAEDDEDDEIASEAEDFASYAGDGVESEVPSESAVEDRNGSDPIVDTHDQEDDNDVVVKEGGGDGASATDDYAGEYEDESFDGAASIASDRVNNAVSAVNGVAAADHAPEADDDDESTNAYSDDDFDNGSETSAAAGDTPALVHTDTPSSPRDHSTASPEPPVTALDNNKDDISIEQLSTALSAVTAQLEPSPVPLDLSVADAVDLNAMPLDASVPLLLTEASGVFPLPTAPLAASVSHDEELLTKSIEEQTQRLEALKERILERTDAIRAVQRHMRVETHREQLTAEESALVDEVTRVEAQLRLDEAALVLARQRNRLERLQLSARHDALRTLDADLLSGFDFVEDVETLSVRIEQATQIEDATVAVVEEPRAPQKMMWGATSDSTSQTDRWTLEAARVASADVDLLRAYAYVEAAESVELQVSRHSSAALDEPEQLIESTLDTDGGLTSEPTASARVDPTELPSLVIGGSRGPISGSDDLDLLRDFAYVEDVESVSHESLKSDDLDLLRLFDFVEAVDPIDASAFDAPASVVAHSPQLPTVETTEDEQLDAVGEDASVFESADGDELVLPAATDGEHDAASVGEDAESEIDGAVLENAGDRGLHSTAGTEDHRASLRKVVNEEENDSEPLRSREDDTSVLEQAHRVADVLLVDLLDAAVEGTQQRIARGAALLMIKPSLVLTHSPVVSADDVLQDARRVRRALAQTARPALSESTRADASLSSRDAASHKQTHQEDVRAEGTEEDAEAHYRGSLDRQEDQVDALTDALFHDLLDDVLTSSLTLGSQTQRRHVRARSDDSHRDVAVERADDTQDSSARLAAGQPSACSTIESSPMAHPVVITPQAPMPASRPPSLASVERAFANAIVQQLELADTNQRANAPAVALPLFDTLDVSDALASSSRALFHVVQATATSVLVRHTHALQASRHADPVAYARALDAFRHDVLSEVEELLAVREATRDAQTRLTERLASEFDGDSDSDSNAMTPAEVRAIQTQLRVPVAVATERMRQTLLVHTTTFDARPLSGASVRRFAPRTPTPTSRAGARRPACVSALLAHESSELEARITDLILNDVLQDAGVDADHM